MFRCTCNALIKELETELLANYSTNIVPKMAEKSRITINATFYLMFIVDFNEREEALTSTAWIMFKWNDPFLAWGRQEKMKM